MTLGILARLRVAGWVALLPLTVCSAAEQRPLHDLLITDAIIVDGTGAPRFSGDVLIAEGRIVMVGDIDDRQLRVERRIPANGRILSPGFIDMHTHGDPLNDRYDGFLAMGVTSVVLGQDGRSAGDESDDESAPTRNRRLADWLGQVEARGVQLNVMPLSGHGTLRRLAGIADSVRVPTAAQQQRMRALLAEDLRAGSFGMSTGLEYVPGIYTQAAELADLAKVVAAFDGIIISHMRTEDDGLIMGAIEELAAYGGKARVQASHLKIVYGKGEDTARALLNFIAAKRAQGVRLSADIYPYTAGYSGLGLIFPEWALPPADFREVATARRDELLAYLRTRMAKRGGPAAFLFGSAPYAGKTLADVAREQGKPFEEVLLSLGPEGGHGAHFVMDERLQDELVASALTAISTDGAPGMRHPRATGAYARLIEHYVVATQRLTLEEAIRKSSGLPAETLGMSDRGVIRPGARADLLLFDPARVKARSSYLKPFEHAQGFDIVIVNGQVTVADGRTLPGNHGQVIRRCPTG